MEKREEKNIQSMHILFDDIPFEHVNFVEMFLW